MIYAPDSLPNKYQIDNLMVKVMYRHTEKEWNCENGGSTPIINIIKIQKQSK